MEKRALVISVISGKGGVGKTVVSSNFAYIAARDFKLNTLLIDANITSSHLSSIMKTPTFLNLNELLAGKKLDPSKFYVYDNTLSVLPSKVFLGSKDYSNISKLKKVVSKLRPKYDLIVVDSAPGIGREALAAIEAADICLIVSTPFVPSLTDVIRVKDVLKELKEKRAKLVLNMIEGEGYEINEDEVKYITGLPVISRLPFDERVLDSVAAGELIAKAYPFSSFSRAMRSLVYNVLSEEFYLEDRLSRWQKFLLWFKNFF